MTDFVIETENLSVYYGKHRGIHNVDLKIEKGEVFGFLGPNGAGKTTTQRVLMDVIRPTAGSARMFGKDCQTDGVDARNQVGYLPGELSLYGNMKADAYFNMYSTLQKNDKGTDYWKILAERLDLDTSRRIRQFSRGNKQKVGVISAFMGKPDLLILDEPTSGLDPLVQQTVMQLLREANEAGATVFFSSHILSEVQAVCDRVGIIRDGQLVAVERVEDLTHQSFKRLRINFASQPPADAFALDGVTETGRVDGAVTLEVRQNLDELMKSAASYGITNIETIPVTLEEIFLAYYGKGNGGNDV
jgi:ABC-2 type transport system ATP-binding protein